MLRDRVRAFAATFHGRNIATPEGVDMEQAILALLDADDRAAFCHVVIVDFPDGGSNVLKAYAKREDANRHVARFEQTLDPDNPHTMTMGHYLGMLRARIVMVEVDNG